jgi:hypothetical protein
MPEEYADAFKPLESRIELLCCLINLMGPFEVVHWQVFCKLWAITSSSALTCSQPVNLINWI